MANSTPQITLMDLYYGDLYRTTSEIKFQFIKGEAYTVIAPGVTVKIDDVNMRSSSSHDYKSVCLGVYKKYNKGKSRICCWVSPKYPQEPRDTNGICLYAKEINEMIQMINDGTLVKVVK